MAAGLIDNSIYLQTIVCLTVVYHCCPVILAYNYVIYGGYREMRTLEYVILNINITKSFNNHQSKENKSL